MNIKAWTSAMRLRTLPLAASCSLVGSAIAWQGKSSWSIFLLCLLTTLLLQILSNLANDYGDFAKGTDNANRTGPARALQSGALSQKQMKRGIAIVAVMCLAAGVSLLYAVFSSSDAVLTSLLFLGLGLLAIAAAIKYTMGNNPYGYKGLGDLFVFLFFGLVGVCGTAYLHTQEWNTAWLFPACTIGFLSSAVLNLNNLRDHVNDKASNKKTVVVMIGFNKGKIYQVGLIALSFIALASYLYLFSNSGWEYLALLPYLLITKTTIDTLVTVQPQLLDPFLKKIAISTFLIAVLLFIGRVAI